MTSSDASPPPQVTLPAPPSRADLGFAIAAWTTCALAAFCLGMTLAAIITQQFMGIMLAMICVPYTYYLLKQEFYAIHHRKADAAWWTGLTLLAWAALTLLSVGAAVIELSSQSAKDLRASLGPLGVVLGFSLLTLVLAIAHFAWSKHLKSIEHHPTAASQFNLREVLGIFALLSIFFGTATALIRNEPIWHGLHLTPVEAGLSLPAAASDVCIQRYPRGSINYEFTIDEAGYRHWIAGGVGSRESQESGTKIEPLQSPTHVHRVLPPDPGISTTDWETVQTGLEYHWRKGDRAVRAIYDPIRKRAFYNQHFY